MFAMTASQFLICCCFFVFFTSLFSLWFFTLYYKTAMLQPFEYQYRELLGSLPWMTMKWSGAVQFVSEWLLL